METNKKDNSSWDNLRRMNAERSKAAKKRLVKERLYRLMVGSGRELKRRKSELREMGYL